MLLARIDEMFLLRCDGTREDFGASFKVEMNEGGVFVIQTPGGGGFGTA